MADHILEAGATKTTGAAAGIIGQILPAALGSGVRPAEVREIGVFNVSGVAAEFGIGFGTSSNGTGTQTSVTVADITGFGATGNTKLVTNYATTNPSAPSSFFRRAEIQAVAGAGVIFTWLPGEWPLYPSMSFFPLIWQISSLAVSYDLYLKVAE